MEGEIIYKGGKGEGSKKRGFGTDQLGPTLADACACHGAITHHITKGRPPQ